MAITEGVLAERLRAARENCGLTQKQAAEAVGLPRTAIVQIEAAARSVSGIELEKLARLYGRNLSELLREGAFDEEPVGVFFRATPEIDKNPKLRELLLEQVDLCREIGSLEVILGRGGANGATVSYELPPPARTWDAVVQGRWLAEQERSRLGLGHSPLWEIAEVLRCEGIRVTAQTLPQEISGVFLHGREIGLVVVVNGGQAAQRQRFSLAHEYCHAVADRSRPGAISAAANSKELSEVRANAFAANILMPESGVRGFLRSLGKGDSSRSEHEVAVDGSSVSALRRASPVAREVRLHDVVALAHHFGVSVESAIRQLQNLKILKKPEAAALLERRSEAKAVARALGLDSGEKPLGWSLAEQLVGLGLEAYRRDEISKRKLVELARRVGIEETEILAALAEEIPVKASRGRRR